MNLYYAKTPVLSLRASVAWIYLTLVLAPAGAFELDNFQNNTTFIEARTVYHVIMKRQTSSASNKHSGHSNQETHVVHSRHVTLGKTSNDSLRSTTIDPSKTRCTIEHKSEQISKHRNKSENNSSVINVGKSLRDCSLSSTQNHHLHDHHHHNYKNLSKNEPHHHHSHHHHHHHAHTGHTPRSQQRESTKMLNFTTKGIFNTFEETTRIKTIGTTTTITTTVATPTTITPYATSDTKTSIYSTRTSPINIKKVSQTVKTLTGTPSEILEGPKKSCSSHSISHIKPHSTEGLTISGGTLSVKSEAIAISQSVSDFISLNLTTSSSVFPNTTTSVSTKSSEEKFTRVNIKSVSADLEKNTRIFTTADGKWENTNSLSENWPPKIQPSILFTNEPKRKTLSGSTSAEQLQANTNSVFAGERRVLPTNTPITDLISLDQKADSLNVTSLNATEKNVNSILAFSSSFNISSMPVKEIESTNNFLFNCNENDHTNFIPIGKAQNSNDSMSHDPSKWKTTNTIPDDEGASTANSIPTDQQWDGATGDTLDHTIDTKNFDQEQNSNTTVRWNSTTATDYTQLNTSRSHKRSNSTRSIRHRRPHYSSYDWQQSYTSSPEWNTNNFGDMGNYDQTSYRDGWRMSTDYQGNYASTNNYDGYTSSRDNWDGDYDTTMPTDYIDYTSNYENNYDNFVDRYDSSSTRVDDWQQNDDDDDDYTYTTSRRTYYDQVASDDYDDKMTTIDEFYSTTEINTVDSVSQVSYDDTPEDNDYTSSYTSSWSSYYKHKSRSNRRWTKRWHDFSDNAGPSTTTTPFTGSTEKTTRKETIVHETITRMMPGGKKYRYPRIHWDDSSCEIFNPWSRPPDLSTLFDYYKFRKVYYSKSRTLWEDVKHYFVKFVRIFKKSYRKGKNKG